MALPLILRKLPQIKGASLLAHQGLVKCAPIAIIRNNNNCFSHLSASKQKQNVLTPLISNQIAPRRLAHGNHSLLWTVEKAFSASLLGIVPAAFIASSPILDNLLVLSVVLHQHWGIEAMVIDYVRPIIFGSLIPKISLLLVYALSAATLGGLLYYNYHDIGVTALIKRFWAVTAAKEDAGSGSAAPKQ